MIAIPFNFALIRGVSMYVPWMAKKLNTKGMHKSRGSLFLRSFVFVMQMSFGLTFIAVSNMLLLGKNPYTAVERAKKREAELAAVLTSPQDTENSADFPDFGDGKVAQSLRSFRKRILMEMFRSMDLKPETMQMIEEDLNRDSGS